MAGLGPAPQQERYRRGAPARGEWKPAEQSGWQHGDVPAAPAGIRPGSQATWQIWFGSWWAVHWTLEDLPGLRLLIYLYDRVARGDMRRLGELRQLMDSYGITPKGQQDRRWLRPEPPRPSAGRSEFDHPGSPEFASAKERLRAIQREGASASTDPRRPLSAKERFRHLQPEVRALDEGLRSGTPRPPSVR
jgi:hypothetical protein